MGVEIVVNLVIWIRFIFSNSGQIPYNAVQERLDLERLTARTIELENRCRHLESLANLKDGEVRRLQEV